MFLAVRSSRRVRRHMEMRGQHTVESSPHPTSAGSGRVKRKCHPFPAPLTVSYSSISLRCAPGYPPLGHTWACWVLPNPPYDAKWCSQFAFHAYPAIRADLAFCWVFFNFVRNWADGVEFLIFFKNVPSTCSFVFYFPLDQFFVVVRFSSLKAFTAESCLCSRLSSLESTLLLFW